MATLAPLKKNTACTLYLEVRAQADPTTFKSGPTLASGDWKVSIDGGAYANLNTTPTASGTIITVALTAGETNGDQIKIKAEDAAGAEWVGRVWTFYTVTNQLDSLSTQASQDIIDDFLDTEIADIRTRLPAALVSGRMDSSVGAMAANVMTAAAAAADLTTELQTGLSTLDAAAVRAALGLALANLDTQLAGISTRTTNLPPDPADASDIGAAFAAVTAALAALNNLSSAQAQTAAAAALNAYDAPTHAEMTTELATSDDAVLAAIAALPTAAAIVTAHFAHGYGAAWNNKTHEEVMKAILALAGGPTAGAGTVTEIYKSPDGSTTVVTVTNTGADTDRATMVLA